MPSSDRPLISVILPIYKVEKYLPSCLDSILAQSYTNLDIILVDDGSPDGCGEICDRYAAADSRIQVIHRINGGVSAARNTGLKAAKGEYIGWVDPDDYIEPDMFSSLFEGLIEHDADVSMCGRIEEYPDHQIRKGFEELTILDTEQALMEMLINERLQNYLWDKLWKRELFDGVTFPEGRTYEDITVMHRLLEKSQRVVCLPGCKYHYLQRRGSIIADVSIKSRINYFLASRERYEDMRLKWPQYEPTLKAQCAVAAIGVWCCWYRNKRQQRDRYLEELNEMAAFTAAYHRDAEKYISLGLAGRMALKLTAHKTAWAFALAAVIGRLYELKNGKTLG